MALSFDGPPLYDKITDANGYLSAAWKNWHGSYNDNLQLFLTQFGILIPNLTTTQVNSIASPTPGQFILNTTTNNPQMYINGAWHNITYT